MSVDDRVPDSTEFHRLQVPDQRLPASAVAGAAAAYSGDSPPSTSRAATGTAMTALPSDPEPLGSTESESLLGEALGPFVAWLATQDLDESTRRRHRVAAERFLRWSQADTGSTGTRRRRYEHHLRHHGPDHLHDARAGLGWWNDYHRILAVTRLTTP